MSVDENQEEDAPILSDLAFEFQSELDGFDSCTMRIVLSCVDDGTSNDFEPPPGEPDDDGPPRRRRKRTGGRCLTMVTDGGTSLDLVGRQLWRGALLLADMIVARRGELTGVRVLELGGGVGILGVVLRLALGPGSVAVITDRDESVLELANRNYGVNKHLEPLPNVQSALGLQLDPSSIALRRLDWLGAWPGSDKAQAEDDFSWAPQELEWLDKGGFSIILCADCIYDEQLTDALFSTILHIFRGNPAARAWLSIEKRYNFELASLSIQAHGYRRFLHHIGQSAEGGPNEAAAALSGRLLPIDFPQCLQYVRVPQLELWEVTLA